MSERTTEPPAPDRLPPTDEAAPRHSAGRPPKAGSPPGAPAAATPESTPASETEHRPVGALAVTAFLVVAILVSWFGMYALNIVRN